MAKKVTYHIEGFDCVGCADKAEQILNGDDRILSASIDVNNEKLFITYKDQPFSLDEMHRLIGRIDGSIVHVETSSGYRKRTYKKGFTKREWVLLSRVIFSLVLMLIAKFVFEEQGHLLWWGLSLYLVAILVLIYDVFYRVIQSIIRKQNPIDMNFLMVIFSLGMFLSYLATRNTDNEPAFFDACMVVALYQIGELVERFASTKAKNTIAAVVDKRADYAMKIVDGKPVKVSPEELQIGDTIIINEGEIVPVDGVVSDGSGRLDTSSITGDSGLLNIEEPGLNIVGGSVLKEGTITLTVTKLFNDSELSKSLEMLQNSGEKKSKGDKFITKFAHIYTPAILGLGILTGVLWGLFTKNWTEGLIKGLLVLVIGCPCAIVISVPLAYSASAGLASNHGVILKSADCLDKLAKVGTLYCDKTGTLTFDDFQIAKVQPIGIPDETFAEYMIAAESRSSHPIARTLCYGQDIASLGALQEDYLVIPGYGVKTRYEGHLICAGNFKFLRSLGVPVIKAPEEGVIIYLSVDGKYAGYVVLYEYIREEAEPLVQKLRSLGVNVIMLSGDTQENTDVLAKILNVNECYADLLPDQKLDIIKKALENKGKTNIAVAGFDDADVSMLAASDVGFSMGQYGSDLAVENSDAVVMKHYPETIYDSIKIAKINKRVVLSNIIVTLAIKLIAAIFVVFIAKDAEKAGLITALADLPITVIMVLHSLSILIRKIK